MKPEETSLIDWCSASSTAARPVAVIGGHGTQLSNWGSLQDDALRVAAALQPYGMAPGCRVAILGGTSRELITAIQAVWLAGCTLTILPLAGRQRSSSRFAEQTRSRVRWLQPTFVLGESTWLQTVGLEPTTAGEPMVFELSQLERLAANASPDQLDHPSHEPGRLALLQLTSGSTAEPRAVMVPERCLVANVGAIRDGLQLDEADRIMSWLPLFHDMGLIGMLTLAMATGTSLVLADTGTFAVQPRRWMEWMSDFQATISCAPNFAYGLAAKTFESGGTYDLTRWRIAINGAEPIDVPTLERFIAMAGVHGFPASAAFCVYGLAEATLAVTFPTPGTGLQVDTIERTALEKAGQARPAARDAVDSRAFPLLGTPLADFELRIRKDAGPLAADREIGELEIKGSSVTPGYLDGPQLPADGWFRTGDLAYWTGEQLVISGRAKDMIIVAGRNLYPEDIERAAVLVNGVRAGNVVAFGVEVNGREAVVVAAECRIGVRPELRRSVARIVRDTVGVSPYDVLLLEPGALPKTSSGKLQRARCRQDYLDGVLAEV